MILCIDMNKDFTGNVKQLYNMITEELPLTNVLTYMHPLLSPWATYDSGTRPIDAILVSPTLRNIKLGGWLPFGSSIRDHRPAYIDLPLETLIGKHRHEIITSTARRLQINHQKAMNKYIKIVEKEFKQHRILERITDIAIQAVNGQQVDLQCFEKIDKLRTRIILNADKNL